jgi:hypothetical protein
MSKMSDFLKKAADKKKGIHHIENEDAPEVERKRAIIEAALAKAKARQSGV